MAGAGLSRSVERLRRRYLRAPAADYLSDVLHTKCKSGSSKTYKGDMDSSLEDTAISLSSGSSQSEFTQSGRKNSTRSFNDFLQDFKNLDCFDEQDSFHDLSEPEGEEKTINSSVTDAVQNIAMYMETDDTLLSHLAANTQTCSEQNTTNGLIRKTVNGTETQTSNSQGLIPPHICQIYDELFVIHQKLQQENSTQQEYALQLQKREHFLTEREALLFRHEAALAKIRGVEEEVHTKFRIIKEQHEAEVKQLTEALREITKENRRLKSSFDTLKEMNDSLRKQLSDVSELNKKLESQARKVQARLENLQRKHEFLMVQKSKDICQVVQQSKPVKKEKGTVALRIAKVPLNFQVYELLTVLMDWISDQHLSKIKIQEEGEDSHKLLLTQNSKKTYTQEKCMKLLPVVAEQLQWMPFVNPTLHMPVIKFIYWSIRQLDAGMQYAAMTSTMRRLGEEVFKGVTSSLQPFLEACSNESFFRTCSVLLRTPKLDLQILEKLCVILQKLSRIKSNKKMFELFTLHLMIQELQRTTHPDHAFLCINLNSILFNLGLARSNSLASRLSTSH
ncbi:coiled-coil domain-containing protein 138 isoform X3 [Rhea pennata]|uniref:coiled-coil domain-containing protein 138 isoform X3 n=1 Tax=Rhea pennata TaxID=8795 RepID=UPI002E264913